MLGLIHGTEISARLLQFGKVRSNWIVSLLMENVKLALTEGNATISFCNKLNFSLAPFSLFRLI